MVITPVSEEGKIAAFIKLCIYSQGMNTKLDLQQSYFEVFAKEPKQENFSSEFLKFSKPIKVDDLQNKSKKIIFVFLDSCY
jgi:hypothetical protein